MGAGLRPGAKATDKPPDPEAGAPVLDSTHSHPVSYAGNIQGPELASAVLRASPPPCRPGLPLAGFRLARARHRQGFPCCHRLPLPSVPPSLPRLSRPVRASLASRPVAAFPVIRAGRPPRCPFRGLLSVHSRCGPHGR